MKLKLLMLSAMLVSGSSAFAVNLPKGTTTVSSGLSVFAASGGYNWGSDFGGSLENRVLSRLTVNSTGVANNLTLSHMLTDSLAVKAHLAVPSSITLDSAVQVWEAPDRHFNILDVKMFAPSVQLQYFLSESGCAPSDFGPTINRLFREARFGLGFGLSHVSFSDAKVSNDAVVQNIGWTDQNLSSTWSPVVSFETVYRLNDQWSYRSSVSSTIVTPDLTLRDINSKTSETSLSFARAEYTFQIGYNL